MDAANRRDYMGDPLIKKLTPTEFIFEYEYANKMPTLQKGKTFDYEGSTYRITHYHQVFGEQAYCSFFVQAKVVNKRA